MPPRDPGFRIADILHEAEKILRYVAELDRRRFELDERTVDAVLKCLAVIGEAASRLPDSVTARYPSVPWKDLRGMRNIVIHEYFGVSLDVVWRTATVDVPELIAALAPKAR